MTISIRMYGDFADSELRSLYAWLLDEPEIRQQAEVRLDMQELEAGDMGTALDAITLVTTSAFALPGFVDVLRGWRDTRRRTPEITIERGDMKATFSEVDPEAVRKILQAISED